ncbi:MAG TPA: hypothetical protein VGQ89_15700 [Candidatus Limnocylindrales bacterium]|jgi:hypothetical protein|nr:hypothetical protein [Candidatus Limnocylindrales bacterium]
MTPEQIDQLIDKYGRPALELAYRQVWINLWISLVLSVVGLVAGAALFRWARSTFRAHPDYLDDWQLVAIGAGIAGALAIGAALAMLALGILPTVLNPDRAALQELFAITGAGR